MKPIPLRVFILGLIWTVGYALIPVAVMAYKWHDLWQDWPDWRVIGPAVETSAALGAYAYWKKYQALLQLPPDIEWAKQLAGDVKRETTVQTVEHQQYPEATVITTVKETQHVPPAPTADPSQEPQS